MCVGCKIYYESYKSIPWEVLPSVGKLLVNNFFSNSKNRTLKNTYPMLTKKAAERS